MINNDENIASMTDAFAHASANVFIKIAYIRRRNGKWIILSEKGKVLGSFDSKKDAVKRLRQIEYFKDHKKTKKSASEDKSYSSIMRELNKSDDRGAIYEFQSTYKDAFDDALLNGIENPEDEALQKALEKISEKKELLEKAASAIDLGDPETAGKYLADLVRFLTRRISFERRDGALQSLKRKIYYLNEYQIASKKTPPSSSLGQSITLLKTILLEHSPQYIRATLNAVVRHL